MILIQDVTVNITGTSRHNGNASDNAHVEMILVTNEPVPAEKTWYVPSGVTVPQAVADILQLANLSMYPQSEETLLAGIEDMKLQAESGNLDEVIKDAAKLMALSIMKKMSLVPIQGATNAYMLAYDYKLFPLKETPNAFELKVQLPFEGMELAVPGQGGRGVRLTVFTPIDANVDQVMTKGVDAAGNEVSNEDMYTIAKAGRQVVSFEYHTDPFFFVRYSYSN